MKTLNYGYDWKYCLSCDYDYDRDCEKHGCDSICRCGRIIDFKITHVYLDRVIKEVTNGEKDKLLLYCVNRILTNYKLYERHVWERFADWGYYGEEIGKILLQREIVDSCNASLKHLSDLTNDTDRVKYVLMQEYGYLLDSLKDLDFSIEKIKRENIEIPNTTYSKKILPADLKCYLDNGVYAFDGPACVVISNQSDGVERLTLVDGYHRYAASAYRSKNMPLQAIVGRLKQ